MARQLTRAEHVSQRLGRGERFSGLRREFHENGPGPIHDGQAADPFAQFCKAMIHDKLIFGMEKTISRAEMQRGVVGAVELFLSRYGVMAEASRRTFGSDPVATQSNIEGHTRRFARYGSCGKSPAFASQ